MFDNKPLIKWYQSGWGIALAGVLALLLFLAVIFLSLLFKYMGDIKNGSGDALRQKVYQGFDRATTTPENPSAKIDRSEIESTASPFFGNPQAKITIVEFIDYKCPNSRAAAPIITKLLEKYAYKVKVIARNFPGESIHKGADRLARFAVCAHEQGRYWEANSELFKEQDKISAEVKDDELSALALKIGLDWAKTQSCMAGDLSSVKVNKDYADGYRAGVGGTPTFFVNGEKIEGVVPFDAWENFVKSYK